LDKKRKEVPVEDEYLTNAIDIDANDVELAKLQGLYHKEFKEAFREALSLLENDEKRLLRQNFVEGLSVEKIGDLHDVHRSTAARWVVQARTQLLENTRRLLMEKLSIRGDTCDSIIRLLSPNLDITFQSYLNTRVAPGVRDDDS
jgi:RNA polymerase sigma-70 factor (ECF subfamily)